jgi:hypothetical protein
LPRVLLFGCDRELVDTLRSDSRWEVAVGEHSDVISKNIPDPRYWNLLVDDCANKNKVYRRLEVDPLGIACYQVTRDYMEEMSRAHGIHFAGSDWQLPSSQRIHLRVFAQPPDGYKTLEFTTTADLAHLLVDFVEEFEDAFVPSHLASLNRPDFKRRDVLFCDAYDEPTMCLWSYLIPWLVSINIPEKSRRIAALQYLCYRSAPKLWPDLYADSFQPRRVKELEEERSRVAAELRGRLNELGQAIDAEMAFYAPYLNLTVLGDDSLKRLVHRAFDEVIGLEVTDLDELVPEGERKTLDLRLDHGPWSAFLEVRSRGSRNAQKTDVERLNEHYLEAQARHGPAASRVLVFNGMYWRDAKERARHKAFDKPTVEEAESTGVCLMTAQQLLVCIEAHRNGELTVDALIGGLSKPGLFAIPQ